MGRHARAGGWTLYLFGTVLLLTGIIGIGYQSLRYWISTARFYASSSRSAARFSPRLIVMNLWSIFPTILLGILIWAFIRMCVVQSVQEVRFGDQKVVLAYRFPWLNQSIDYRSITNVNLADDRPVVTLPDAHPHGGFPVKVVVETRDGIYEIKYRASSWDKKALAIYDELNRHIGKLAQTH